jgi:hypothetical protein
MLVFSFVRRTTKQSSPSWRSTIALALLSHLANFPLSNSAPSFYDIPIDLQEIFPRCAVKLSVKAAFHAADIYLPKVSEKRTTTSFTVRFVSYFKKPLTRSWHRTRRLRTTILALIISTYHRIAVRCARWRIAYSAASATVVPNVFLPQSALDTNARNKARRSRKSTTRISQVGRRGSRILIGHFAGPQVVKALPSRLWFELKGESQRKVSRIQSDELG